MKKFIAFAFAALLLTAAMPSPAHAMDVATAKQQGLIGEQPDGMLGIVTKVPSPELTELVKQTNIQRLAIYKDMSTKQGIVLPQIQEMAGTKIYSKEKKGNYLQYNGEWQLK